LRWRHSDSLLEGALDGRLGLIASKLRDGAGRHLRSLAVQKHEDIARGQSARATADRILEDRRAAEDDVSGDLYKTT
jgi:hypothetical protein